jgi:hypothetical protein
MALRPAKPEMPEEKRRGLFMTVKTDFSVSAWGVETYEGQDSKNGEHVPSWSSTIRRVDARNPDLGIHTRYDGQMYIMTGTICFSSAHPKSRSVINTNQIGHVDS